MTNEQEKEFNNFNAGAFELLRKEAEGSVVTWLCMSAEAKKEAQDKFYLWCQSNIPDCRHMSKYAVTKEINRMFTLDSLTQRWKQAELMAEEERNKGNPRAFFT